jgi:hypothetical protein
MGKSRNLAVHDFRVGPLLEFAYGFHLAVGPQQLLFWDGHIIAPENVFSRTGLPAREFNDDWRCNQPK